MLGFKPCTLKIEKQLSVDCGCLSDEEFTSVGWGSDIVETSGIDEVIGTVEGVAGLDMGVFGTEVGTAGLVHETLAEDTTLEDALVGGDTKLEVVSAVADDDTTLVDAIADISADVTFGLMALMASAMNE